MSEDVRTSELTPQDLIELSQAVNIAQQMEEGIMDIDLDLLQDTHYIDNSVPVAEMTEDSFEGLFEPSSVLIVENLGFGISDMPLEYGDFMKLTHTQINALLETIGKAPDDEDVVVINNPIPIQMDYIDLMWIKGLYDMYPGLSEYRVITSTTRHVIVRQPVAVIVNDAKQEYRIREVYCKLTVTRKGLSNNLTVIDNVEWIRPMRTVEEHASEFTLSHVNSTKPGKWATGCLGTSDLYYFTYDSKEKKFDYYGICSILVSIRGYTQSEFADGAPDISIGDLYKLVAKRLETQVVKDNIFRYTRQIPEIKGLTIEKTRGGIHAHLDADNPEFIDQISSIPNMNKVIYINKNNYGQPAQMQVDIDAINRQRISCGMFRNKQLIYSVYMPVNDKVDQNSTRAHPDITEQAAKTINLVLQELCNPYTTYFMDTQNGILNVSLRNILERTDNIPLTELFAFISKLRQTNNDNGGDKAITSRGFNTDSDTF